MKEAQSLLDLIEVQEEELKKLKKAVEDLNYQSQQTDHTISYRLGYALIHDTKTLKGIIGLPKRLFEIYQYSLEKKAIAKLKKQGKDKGQSSNLSVIISHLQENIDNRATFQPQINDSRLAPVVIKNSLDNTYNLKKGLTLLDPISELCWADTFTGFPLARSNFADQIKVSTSQFAFFESAWRANKSSWLYAFTSPGLKHANAQALLEAINILKQRNIPILFWNKEDPMHYEMFKPIAKYADYIFTTDALIIDKYKKDLGIQNVYALPFAAPVKKTNPLARFSLKTETVCFAGTYYAKNHEDRKRQMDMLLPALLENNGCIYDRASSEQKEDYAYPSQYKDILRPSVDFKDMMDLYKKFKIFLNVNTITQSPTMMSRRVYELLASGTPVISTPSKAIAEQFAGIVITVNNEQEAKLAVRKLLEDSYYWHKQSMLGIREVMQNHTYEQRWSQIESIVLKKPIEKKTPRVRIVCIYHGYVALDIYLSSLLEQKNIELSDIVLLKSSLLHVDDALVKSFKVNVVDLSVFNLKKYIKESDPTEYTFITDDRVYNYKYSLWGMCLSFNYSDASAIIRSTYYKYSKIYENFNFEVENPNWYEFMKEVPLSCFLIKNQCIENIAIDLHSKKAKCIENKKKILMIDPFNVVALDQPKITQNKNNLNDFIYRTSPYLGI